MTEDATRRAALIAAERQAEALLAAIEEAKLIAAGRDERFIEDAIYALAEKQFNVARHWHKRIVRSGPNSVTIFSDKPPNRTVEADDVVYVDLGPVFEEWEADIGRTYVLGNHPAKRSLVRDLERIFETVQAHFHASPGITGADLYAFAQAEAARSGWIFGGTIAGHIISEFGHTLLPGDKDRNRIDPLNVYPMSDLDSLGRVRHWILEIHLLDPSRTFGGFYERLL